MSDTSKKMLTASIWALVALLADAGLTYIRADATPTFGEFVHHGLVPALITFLAKWTHPTVLTPLEK